MSCQPILTKKKPQKTKKRQKTLRNMVSEFLQYLENCTGWHQLLRPVENIPGTFRFKKKTVLAIMLQAAG